MSKKTIFVFSLSVLVFPLLSFAQTTPVVTSFAVNPTSISNAYTAVFSWDVSNGQGVNLYFSCPTGVSVKNESGSLVSCDTAVGAGGSASAGNAAFSFINVSGSSKTITVRLVPKDTSNAEQPSSASSVNLTVSALAEPITSATLSPFDIKSGETTKLTWSSVYIAGVNLQFDCVTSVRITTTASPPTDIDCGKMAFTSDLAASGTYEFKVYNTSTDSKNVRVSIIPAVGSGYYDATKAKSGEVTVNPVAATPSASAGSLGTSKTSVYSDEPFDIYWRVDNASGANLQFQCPSSNIIVSAVIGTTTSPLPCIAPAFTPPLGVSGTTTISVKNKDWYSTFTDLNIVLLPKLPDGTYTGTNSKTITVRVMSAAGPAASPVPALSPAPNTPVPSPSASASKLNITLALGKGSRSAQVAALQAFLAKDKTIYPEGLATGYFGAATEAAVRRFQVKYGIAKSGDVGYGFVGPKTRLKLNSLSTP